jgi:hypothetical protein
MSIATTVTAFAEQAETEGINPVLNGVISFVALLVLLLIVLAWGRGRS